MNCKVSLACQVPQSKPHSRAIWWRTRGTEPWLIQNICRCSIGGPWPKHEQALAVAWSDCRSCSQQQSMCPSALSYASIAAASRAQRPIKLSQSAPCLTLDKRLSPVILDVHRLNTHTCCRCPMDNHQGMNCCAASISTILKLVAQSVATDQLTSELIRCVLWPCAESQLLHLACRVVLYYKTSCTCPSSR